VTPTATPPPNAPSVTVQVNNPAPNEPSPFGLENQLAEVRRRLEDLEREMSSLKARQASAEARDSNFESKLAELVVAREALEKTAKDIERGLKNFQSSVEAQYDETRLLVRDALKTISWRAIAMVVAAFLGGALLKLIEQVIPGLSRHEIKAAAENAVALLF
jgi:hypothetical protein